jgi:hypothetical protein
MDVLVIHSEDKEVEADGAVSAPTAFKTSPSNVKIKLPSKSVPKKPLGLQPEANVIVDLVHEIENLKKHEALARVAQLEDKHAMTYFEIGGVLSAIRDNKWFDPSASFDEWVEQVTAMKRAKAHFLIQIYNSIVASEVTWPQVKHIGWTKLLPIARVLTKENADHWIDVASKNGKRGIEKLVKEHLISQGGPTHGSSPVTTMIFKAHEDQKVTIEAAIEKAKSASNTEVATVALEYICLDFMGGQSMSERLQAIGTAASANAVKSAFTDTDVLAQFIKAFGVNILLQGLEKVEPTWTITIEVPSDEPTQIDDLASAEE